MALCRLGLGQHRPAQGILSVEVYVVRMLGQAMLCLCLCLCLCL